MDTKIEADKLNAELLALKKDIFASLRAKKDELALSLMLPFVCEEFMRSKSRLMIIGQETFGWNFKESEAAVMQKRSIFSRTINTNTRSFGVSSSKCMRGLAKD